MFDKQICVQSLIACVLWVVGAVVIAVAIMRQLNGVAPAGLALIMAGCMVDLHGMFADLERRESQAFELGRRLTSISERDRV